MIHNPVQAITFAYTISNLHFFLFKSLTFYIFFIQKKEIHIDPFKNESNLVISSVIYIVYQHYLRIIQNYTAQTAQAKAKTTCSMSF